MKEMFTQINAMRKTLGRRKMSMNTFYVVRRKLAEKWLYDRILQYPTDYSKWSGNPYLATGRNGGYVFSQKNANALVAAAVQFDVKKPRGRPVALGFVAAR